MVEVISYQNDVWISWLVFGICVLVAPVTGLLGDCKRKWVAYPSRALCVISLIVGGFTLLLVLIVGSLSGAFDDRHTITGTVAQVKSGFVEVEGVDTLLQSDNGFVRVGDDIVASGCRIEDNYYDYCDLEVAE